MPLPHEVRVTQLDAFRIWEQTEDLDMDWLLPRILGNQEETEVMRAGTALHKALEHLDGSELEIDTLLTDEYRFDFNCGPCEIMLPTIRETEFVKHYGDILVAGHVDGLIGNAIIDYKTTAAFDAERYMESYQWRYYLDLSGCDQFLYQIFVMKDFGPPHCYSITAAHTLKQYRYPELHTDCENLVREYEEIVLAHQELMAK